ncbi:hypothetical protein [Miniphocaeibacter massiliensis]|uniref:hypothetical protein n=1 Tax=Miniphocaeibacter massiliensis TaxID=2041841 RepID=UPI000C077389|nr:hypothetical protein [Miniphocaeibacter massiliensis]
MSSILEMISNNSDKVLKVPLFCIFSMVIVFIIFKFIKKEGIAKYLFGLAMLATALILLIVALTNLTNPVALTTLEFFVLTLASGVVSLCMAWFLDIFFTKNKPKVKKVKKTKKAKVKKVDKKSTSEKITNEKRA